MHLRKATNADKAAMAELAAGLQAAPDRFNAYLSADAPSIAADIEEIDDWTAVSAVAERDGTLIGWIVGDVDATIGRVWWIGPIVAADAWTDVASALHASAVESLPVRIEQGEFAVDDRFTDLMGWAEGRGFIAGLASLVLATDRAISAPFVSTRAVVATDLGTVGVLHDRLFPNTHLTGGQLVTSADDTHVRFVTVDGGGYVVVERQPDGFGYIDFLGVDEDHRRCGYGAGLVAAAAVQLRAMGCERIHLTVRDDNVGARALYLSLGFEEERRLVPLRKGFTIA